MTAHLTTVDIAKDRPAITACGGVFTIFEPALKEWSSDNLACSMAGNVFENQETILVDKVSSLGQGILQPISIASSSPTIRR